MMKKKQIAIIILSLITHLVYAQDKPKPDTIDIDGVVIIRDNDSSYSEHLPKKGFFKKINSKTNPKNIKTEWAIVDIGISNFADNTNYIGADAQGYAPGSNEEWMKIKPFKSRNINIWLVTQSINLLKHVVHFQYGVGVELNNYFYKQPLNYSATTEAVSNAAVITLDNTPDRIYKKNKLAADYVTVPLMLNFNFTPYRLYPIEVSGGISVGYLYSARNKTVTSDQGKQKQKDDFDLQPWKLSYVGELGLGFVTFYGSYAFKSMYKRGLDMTPYTFGIRIKPTEIFAKLQTN